MYQNLSLRRLWGLCWPLRGILQSLQDCSGLERRKTAGEREEKKVNILKKKARRTVTRYRDFNEFQKTLMEEAARMEKRLRAKGIAVVSLPVLARM